MRDLDQFERELLIVEFSLAVSIQYADLIRGKPQFHLGKQDKRLREMAHGFVIDYIGIFMRKRIQNDDAFNMTARSCAAYILTMIAANKNVDNR